MGRYSKEQIKQKAAERDRKLSQGTYRLRILAAAKRDPKEPKYNLSHQLQIGLVKSDGELTSSKVTHFVTWPYENSEIDGHEAPNTFGMVAPLVQAVFPEDCPTYPRRDRETKSMMYRGETITPDEVGAAKEEATQLLDDKMDVVEKDAELWPTSDDGSSDFYGQLFYQKNPDTGEVSDFPSLRYFSAEEPNGKYAPIADDAWWNGNGGSGGGSKGAAAFKGRGASKPSKGRASRSKSTKKTPTRKRR